MSIRIQRPGDEPAENSHGALDVDSDLALGQTELAEGRYGRARQAFARVVLAGAHLEDALVGTIVAFREGRRYADAEAAIADARSRLDDAAAVDWEESVLRYAQGDGAAAARAAVESGGAEAVQRLVTETDPDWPEGERVFLDMLDAAVRCCPGNGDLRVRRAHLLLERRAYSAAFDDFEAAGRRDDLIAELSRRVSTANSGTDAVDRLFAEVTDAFPAEPEFWRARARFEAQTQRFSDAARSLASVLTYAPEDAEALVAQCDALRRGGRLTEARDAAAGALGKSGDSTELFTELARALLALGQDDELLDRLQQVRPAAAVKALSALVNDAVQHRARNPAVVIQAAIERLGRSPALLVVLGQLLEGTGRLTDASDTYREAIGAAPDHDEGARAAELGVLIALGAGSRAPAAAAEARACEAPDHATLMACAEVAARDGQAEQAVDDIERAVGRSKLPAVVLGLASDRPAALRSQLVEAALERQPTPALWATRAAALLELGAIPEALDAWRRAGGAPPYGVFGWPDGERPGWDELTRLAVEGDSWTPVFAELRADFLIQQGRERAAVEVLADRGPELLEEYVRGHVVSNELLEAAGERFPDNIFLLLTRAERLAASGNGTLALENYSAVLAREPDCEPALIGQVRVLRTATPRDLAKAAAALEEAERRRPGSPRLLAERGLLDLEERRFAEAARGLVDAGLLAELHGALEADDRPVADRIALAKAALDLRPDDAKIAVALGAAHAVADEPHLAEVAYRRALVTGRLDLWAVQGLAGALHSMHRLEAARAVLDELLTHLPAVSEFVDAQRRAPFEEEPEADYTLPWIANLNQFLNVYAGVALDSHDTTRAIEAAEAAARCVGTADAGAGTRILVYRTVGRRQQAQRIAEAFGRRDEYDRFVMLQTGWLAIEQGRFDDALQCFERILEEDVARSADRVHLLWEAAGGLDFARCSQRAFQVYDEILRLDPQFVYALHNRASLLWDQGTYRKARAEWDAARGLYDARRERAEAARDANQLAYRASISREVEGDYATAAELYGKSIDLNADQPLTLASLALVHLEWSRTTQAEKAGSQHIHVDHFWKASVCYEKAQRLLDRWPLLATDAEALAKLAEVAVELRDFDTGARLLDRAQGLTENPSTKTRIHQTRGLLFSRGGERHAAVREFEQAFKLTPSALSLRCSYADAQLKNGQREDALEMFAQVLEIAPGQVEAHVGVGEVYLELAESQEDENLFAHARAHFTEALDYASSLEGSKRLLPTERAKILYQRGYARVAMYEHGGQAPDDSLLRDARTDFRECVRLDETHYKAHRAVAKIDERRGRWSAERVAERLAPYLVAIGALLIFVLAQTSLLFGDPVAKIAITAYASLSFGALLFLAAGLFLPRVLKLKVGGLELEKSVVEQVAVSSGLGIRR